MSLFFLIGFMGSGKTTMGRIIAQKLGCNFVDMDVLIESREGKSVSQIFSEYGENTFRNVERQYLQELGQCENTIIATGGGVPCFFDNMEYMNSQGKTIYIKLTPAQLKTRLELSKQNKRPLLAQKQGNELLQYIADTLTARERFYNKASFIIGGSDEEIEEKLTSIISNK